MRSFGHIFCFVCTMDMLEPMRPLVSALQGRLVEVYFGFKKVEELMNSYTDIQSGIDTWFSHEKRAHYELCALVAEVISKKDENAVTSLLNVLKEKWEHIVPLPASLESELFRWSNDWKRQEAMPDESAASIIASHADGIFFPSIRELLKILAVLPIGSTEAERSFSRLCRLHTWLSIYGTPSKKDDGTITFWAVNIVEDISG